MEVLCFSLSKNFENKIIRIHLLFNNTSMMNLTNFERDFIKCPIKSQILYFRMCILYFCIHSIKHTVFQYVCAKNRILTICKINILENSIKHTLKQYVLYCCAKNSIIYTVVYCISVFNNYKIYCISVYTFFIGLTLIELYNFISQ